ncbi:MAG: DUF1501 domain-containing protein [Arachidicoccus sp.]|nr:DUF1501 domain-containing protein [Arachidicoccus sp.]
MLIKRRDFLQIGSMATASMMLPKFVKALYKNKSLAQLNNKSVVVIQLSGGNDGLNTVIPFQNDIYHRSRPVIGFKQQKVNILNDEAALHPALTGFKNLYDEGSLAILNNVGYPDPDRSHFRSMDIWQSASSSKEIWQTGWLGRYLDETCENCKMPVQALEVDDVLSLALKGNNYKGIAVKNPQQLYNNSKEKYYNNLLASHEAEHAHNTADYLYKTMAETLSSADYIYKESKTGISKGVYPKTQLGNNLKTIASLIMSEINTKVYYVSIGSFDTHVNQQERQNELFTQLNNAVSAFVKDLQANNKFNDVLLFTFSEFGRRVAQNAANGTDHGTANNMFLISGALKQKGLINAMPDLNKLDNGDLIYQVDFKQVYATILKKWLNADDAAILQHKYDYLNFI